MCVFSQDHILPVDTMHSENEKKMHMVNVKLFFIV